jgi:parallel beta-helix repeat protein
LITSGTDNTISYNHISGNVLAGVKLDNADRTTLLNNSVEYANLGSGIVIFYSDNNSICDNTISFNNYAGITFDNSNDSTILRNELRNNVESDVNLDSFSVRNHFYHNNFYVIYGSCVTDDGNNFWNASYPTGGNYWDNYTGVDSDGDGLGDTPYTNISGGGNHDMYPYMQQDGWLDPPDDWPMFQHDAHHTSYSKGTGPDTNQTLWSYTYPETGYCCHSPVVYNGTVYVMFTDKDHNGDLIALNANNGSVQWKHRFLNLNYSQIIPLISNETVYVGNRLRVDAFFASNGLEKHDTAVPQLQMEPFISGNKINYLGMICKT